VKPIFKVLLILEVLVCFAPMAYVLLLGFVIVMMQLMSPFSLDSLTVVGPVLAGIAGLLALANVLLWLLKPPSSFLSRVWTWIFMLLGLLPILPYALLPVDSIGWRVAGLMPLLCTGHLIYLARGFLLVGQSPSQVA
jgi:hypothetical protein